jgi:uncharacterized protein
MKAKSVFSFWLVIFSLLLLGGKGLAQDIPIPKPVGDIYVQDFARILTENEISELRSIGRSIEDATTAQVAVLTVQTTGEQPIQEFANAAFREYGIGQQKTNNGVLLVLAMEDRKIWVEVGYGLEGRLPDGKVGRILDTYAVPHLQNQQPNQAILDTYKVLGNEVLSEYGLEDQQLQPQPPSRAYAGEAGGNEGNGISTLFLIILVVVLLFLDFKFFGGFLTHMLLSILSRGGGRGGSGGGGGGFRGGGGGSSGGGGAGRGW